MLCIIKRPLESNEISAWIISDNMTDAIQKLYDANDKETALKLYQMQFMPAPGKYKLNKTTTMLVS